MGLSERGVMPKETITDPGTTYIRDGYVTEEPLTSDEAKGLLAVESPRLEVNWMRPSDIGVGFVQVSMRLDSRHIKELADRLDDGVVASWVYTDSLTRKQINDAIRILRRARDSAYGADE